jgi:hypothetical protein
MSTMLGDVPSVSQEPENSAGPIEVLDAAEFAKRIKVPVSWVRTHTRARTPKAERIPCRRLGRYVRFLWNSPKLNAWLKEREQQ